MKNAQTSNLEKQYREAMLKAIAAAQEVDQEFNTYLTHHKDEPQYTDCMCALAQKLAEAAAVLKAINNADAGEVGGDLVITKTTRRTAGGGTWVCGTLGGHRFEALVFPAHADHATWELGNNRISKLWVQRLADKKMVYHWDRGLDMPAENKTVQALMDFLCAGLAEHTYAK